MSGGDSGQAKKQAYFNKLIKLLDEYTKIFIVGVDNVGSNQMQKIRQAIRGKAVVLMGKNTMIRKAIRGHVQNNPVLENLLAYVRGNVGFVFVKDDLAGVKKLLVDNKVSAPAKVGQQAPQEVIVPKGNTGLEPTQTSFFQALNIQTKINKGQIEIVNDVNLIKLGQKVGVSEANLLTKLDIKPFRWGLSILQVYDSGAIFSPSVLDLTDSDLLAKFNNGVRNVAALSLQVGLPTVASLPHSVARAFKNVLSVALETNYPLKQAEEIKNMLANPQAYQQPKAEDKKPDKKEEKKEEKKKEPEPVEEDDADMGLSLFD